LSSVLEAVSRRKGSKTEVEDRSGSGDQPVRPQFRKILKVLKDPKLAFALFNAQLHLRWKAKVPLSVRLTGRARLKCEGTVRFGRGVILTGDIVPIELICRSHAHISIGDHTFINYGLSISAFKKVSIGHHCLIGHHVLIVDRNEHGVDHRDTPPPPAPVVIEDHVWIGSRVVILPGVCIGHHSVVGAGSVVTKSVPANCLAVGNPARVVRKFARVAVAD
jgi:acetyltransferase-like isoleucine patch superfamily enzyme